MNNSLASTSTASTWAGSNNYYHYSAVDARIGLIQSSALAGLTERHRLKLPEAHALNRDPSEVLQNAAEVDGLIIELPAGLVGFHALRIARIWLKAGRPVFAYFPREEAIEVLDAARWWSLLKLRIADKLYRLIQPVKAAAMPANWTRSDETGADFELTLRGEILPVRNLAAPVPLLGVGPRGAGPRLDGLGLYLRTDYWAKLRAGGSYGHTCYVARELARRSHDFLCIMASRYKLLDDFGLRQFVLPREHVPGSEREMLLSSLFYRQNLQTLIDYLKPAYIYERLVPGNFAGAALSQKLGIPYIVEYNGSELSMARSFNDKPYDYEQLFIEAEQAAFRQATAISVISEIVRDQVVKAGIEPTKILINPNGADTDDYRPPSAAEKRALRQQLGWKDTDIVIGFVGTFGGWHGIEILAAALPRVCALGDHIKFLLIGGGNLHKLVVEATHAHDLARQVNLTGPLPQEEARVLLRASDIFVSPHHRDMVDSKFFGSPTKLFEYMAIGGAVVASDLEQIGAVLAPSFGPEDLSRPGLRVDKERAVLCKPGDVDEFVMAVSSLCRMPAVRQALGANARQAVIAEYSWSEHVDRVLDFAGGLARAHGSGASQAVDSDSMLDPYKREAQRQWDADPCGSHYVKERDDRRAFFMGVESHRYGEYGPWMPRLMEFDRHRGERVLEIGAGMGTDLAQFARNGAIVTDFDLSTGHMALAQENFALRGLAGEFIHGDAENMPFADNTFDVVYSNGVIHHIPQTQKVIGEILRVLKPGGKAIVMVYRENSLQHWRNVYHMGLRQGMLEQWSMNEIMSRSVEISNSGARPLVKVYTSRQMRSMFGAFSKVSIHRRQLVPAEVPAALRWIPVSCLERLLGWNLIVKAVKR